MKYLVVMSWPAGMGVVVLIALVLTRRPESPAAPRRWAGRPSAASAGPASRLPDPVRLIGITLVGWIAAVAVMLALGAAWVVHDGSDVDRPVYAFAVHHRVVDWTLATTQLTKIADLPESLLVAVLAAVWLALGWDRRRWVPPVILATIVVADHFLTAAIRGVFERVGPPNSPGGAYPSGGCERAVLYFGLIAYLFLHEAGWCRRRRIWVGAAVAAVALNEVYTRTYLTLHWFTDALSGSVYGALVLMAVIVAVRTVIGPARSTSPA